MTRTDLAKFMLLPLSSVLFHSEKWNIAVWSDEVRKFNHIQLKRLLIRISIWLANNVLAIDFTNLHPVSNCRCARKLSKYSLKSPLLEHGNTRWCRVVAVVTKYYDRRIEWPLFLQENINLEGGGVQPVSRDFQPVWGENPFVIFLISPKPTEILYPPHPL